jgi:hypothetical protein
MPAGRKVGSKHDIASRERIQTSQLINRLNAFALEKSDPQTGKPVVMSDTQVRAALGLLKKTVPDLSQTTAHVTHSHRAEELSDPELTDIAAGRSARAVAQTSSAPEPDQLH